MNEITQLQKNRFENLNKKIKEGMRTVVEVGDALREIRDDKLYRGEHGTFELYCQRVWGWSRQHCNQLIIAAPILKLETALSNSAVAAVALSRVPPPKRAGVVAQIVATGKKVTASAIAKVAGKPPVKPVKIIKDGTGLTVPKEVVGLWERMPEAQVLMTAISTIRGALKKAQEEKDILFSEVDFTDNLAKLNQVYVDIQRAKPFAVCPTCSGVNTKGCLICSGRGLISEFLWKHSIPEETKKLTGRK